MRVDRGRVAERMVTGLPRSLGQQQAHVHGRRVRHRVGHAAGGGERVGGVAAVGSGDTGERLGGDVEGLELVVAERPVDEAGPGVGATRVAQRRGEAEVDLVEARVLHVGVNGRAADGAAQDVDVFVRHRVHRIALAERARLDDRVLGVEEADRELQLVVAVQRLRHSRCRIVEAGEVVVARLDDQHLEARLGQGIRRCRAARAAADDDRVEAGQPSVAEDVRYRGGKAHSGGGSRRQNGSENSVPPTS